MVNVVISLGGSLIIPNKIDAKFLKKFKKVVLDYVKKGNKVIIVCGGGNICREYFKAASDISKTSVLNLDRLGIKATQLNAELLRVVFADYAYKEVVLDYNDNKNQKLKFKIMISCGFVTGHSSDFDAVMWAKNYNADYIVNLSNVNYIYSKDPKKDKNAVKLKELKWNELQKIVGTKWNPGANLPFDPIATKYAKKFGLKVAFMDGKDINNFKKFLNGDEFKGSVVS